MKLPETILQSIETEMSMGLIAMNKVDSSDSYRQIVGGFDIEWLNFFANNIL